MKNRSSKTILVFFALGLISCAFCVQQAQAIPITGAITFAGGVELNSVSVNTASAVTTWLDESFAMPTVQSASGSFAGLDGATATFAFPWTFNSGPIAAFWTVGGFTFNLLGSSIISQIGDGFLLVSGTGTITGPGYATTTGVTWLFSVQDDPSNGVFSFSGGSEAIPDGGATVALLGLALAGIEGIRRKLIRAKS
jgi:hypothetical protein